MHPVLSGINVARMGYYIVTSGQRPGPAKAGPPGQRGQRIVQLLALLKSLATLKSKSPKY